MPHPICNEFESDQLMAPNSGRDAEDLFPQRSRLAHGIVEPRDFPTVVFVTVCTDKRVPWLADEAVHRTLCEIWTTASAWQMGRYVIMPDHLHLFCAPGTPELPLDNWVRYWKSQYSKLARRPGQRWQTDHWDTRIRSWAHYAEKWEYVRFNPVRKKLCMKPEDWIYQGELNQLW